MIEKILLADDSSAARLFLKACIPKDRGYQLIEAVDGQDAVSKFKENSPDITFLDLTMPALDGYGALQEIRKVDGSAVVVVLSSNIQKKSVERVIDSGAFSFIQKPPTPEKIHGVLREIEKSYRQEG